MSALQLSKTFSLPLDVVTEAVGIVATRGAGKSYASAVLIEEAFAAHVQTVVIDPTGVYHGLRSNAKGIGPGLAIYVFGGPHGDLPLEATAGKFMADLVVDSGHSFVLDLSDFTKDKARGFVADFLERLYERKARNRTPLLLVVDEADDFAPQKPRGRAAFSLGAMETIAKRGRSRGVGIVMITQRTQALNKDVLDLIETLIAMRQLAERSRDAVKGWIADKDLRDEHGVIESLQSLPTGTAWVWSPLRAILTKVQVRRIRTFDSYRTPKPGEVQEEPTQRAELDLDALGEQMRATVERVKQNDPRELKREVAQLRRELETRPAEVEVVEKIVEVEKPVPVLTEEELAAVRKATEAFYELRDVFVQITRKVHGAERPRAIAVGDDPDPEPMTDEYRRARLAPPTDARQVKPGGLRPGPDTSHTNGSDVKLNRKAERAVLAALAQYPEGRTKRQVAVISGYAMKGGGFNGALSKLRTAGYIVGSDHLRITDAGIAAIDGQYEPLPTGRALLDHWLGRMDRAAERRVLEVLWEAGGETLSKAEVADRAGYEETGGGFNGALSKLRTLQLIEGSRELRASADLFD